MFIGYAENSATYKFLVTKSENSLIDVKTIIETKNARSEERRVGKESMSRTPLILFVKIM